ncbi:putative pectate lyase 2 [Selaginella moellendorffii]|uniref:putative pectate lyase 2 n=1 Tax=Selaginella moellendorffii TaxID=88036 RepID=UPI000D1CC71B|nr:putative pectate lyase 2 [Selaginella moellendorffii]|eukprot:XP_024542404.1 putative pectate lyase 2 [Selaginella moellendorffii]
MAASLSGKTSFLHLCSYCFFVFLSMQVEAIVPGLSSNRTRSLLQTLSTGNAIDDCRKSAVDWNSDRMHMAGCGIGFGSGAFGGANGNYYTVTDPSDDPLNPQPGTLRYAVIQEEPVWIVFQSDMTITLRNELVVNSHKTLDGRGASVHIAHGACITIFRASRVIIHGLNIHHCVTTEGGWVATKPGHLSHRGRADGDGIRVFESHHVWIDHNSFWECHDGLVDVLHGSNFITISNNHFHDHDKVMLLGHADESELDHDMKITVVYNRFGPRCVQRMPRCRFGYFHVANNDYHAWEMYAIGGSAHPTIISQGNRFLASDKRDAKEITKRVGHAGDWISIDDVFLNGAFFVESGRGDLISRYTPEQQFEVKSGSQVTAMTAEAGVLKCQSSLATC